jgi:hypothetical protein
VPAHAAQDAADDDEAGGHQRTRRVLPGQPLLTHGTFEVIAHEGGDAREDDGLRDTQAHAGGDDGFEIVEE